MILGNAINTPASSPSRRRRRLDAFAAAFVVPTENRHRRIPAHCLVSTEIDCAGVARQADDSRPVPRRQLVVVDWLWLGLDVEDIVGYLA